MEQFLVQLTLCVVMCSECLYLSWIKKRLDQTLQDLREFMKEAR